MNVIYAAWDNLIENFFCTFGNNWLLYVLEFIMFSVLFYLMFKVLKSNRANKFIAVNVIIIIFSGIIFAVAGFAPHVTVIIIFMYALIVFMMYNTEIKRLFFDSRIKKRKSDHIDMTGIERVIDETVRAVQNMSKNDIGALIVLSNDNLPEGIIESGTVINAQITSQMIEAVFYPKAPLHDGALIVEGNKIYAAGCFLPIAQNENLPKDMGSRHRAALGVTTVASVTAIVVSEETGIISIVKNGEIKKKYADAADLKNALSEYYWSDLTAEGKL